MYTVLKNAVIRYILPIYRYFSTDNTKKDFSRYGLDIEKTMEEDNDKPEAGDQDRLFGEAISDAEYLISKNMFREALGIYRKLSCSLSGKNELMKIQFVRDKIEILLHRINEEPTMPEAAQVIEEEKKSAAERYKATIIEADHYFEHELYNESMFLYRKLQKEWANSNDSEKINLIKEKIDFLNEMVDDAFKVSSQPKAPSQIIDTKDHTKTNELTRLFGEMITDAEHLMNKKLYREALGIYRKLNDSLTGSGELMKIQFVRDKIETLFNLINLEPTFPEAAQIIEEEKKSAEQRYAATILEADHYFEHELYNESLFLYRKLEKEWGNSHDLKKLRVIREKVEALKKIVIDSAQPEESGQVIYLAEDGSLTEIPPEEYNPVFSKFASKIIAFMLTQRFVLIMAYICIFSAGMFCFMTSPFEKMPSVDRGEVYISTNYYGASVNDVEHLVTTPIEKAIQELENVSAITSKSYRNRSSVGVKFVDHSNYSEMYSRLKVHILNFKSKLPEGCEDPTFLFVDTQERASVIQVNLFGKASALKMESLAEKLKTVLHSIQGIRDIEIIGKSTNEVQVTLSPEKLKMLGVAFSDVTDALRSAGTNTVLGQEGGKAPEITTDAVARFSRQGDILNVIVRKDGQGHVVRLSDVVTSAMLSQLDPMNLASVNGNEAISLIVRQDDSANAIAIAKQVKEISDDFSKKHITEGIISNVTHDSTQEIIDSVRTFSWDLMLGIILVAAMLWITFGLRNAMLSVVIIPFSFFCTLIVKMLLGIPVYAINLFTFILVSGIVIDNIMVIIENIHRHHQMDKTLERSVIDGVAEIFWPLVISMLATVMAFIPMFLISGPTGSFFVMMPLAVIFAVCASLVGAMVFLPTHMIQWGPKQVTLTNTSVVERLMNRDVLNKAWHVYEIILDRFLDHRKRTMILILLFFCISMGIAGLSHSGIVPLLKVKLFPVIDRQYHITVALPSGTPIRETDKVIRDISTYILSLGEKQVKDLSGLAGYYTDRDDSVANGSQYGQVIVGLPQRSVAQFPENPENDPDKHMDYIMSKLNVYLTEHYPEQRNRPHVNVFPETSRLATDKALSIRISGDNLDQTLEVSNRIMAFLKNGKETQALYEISDDRAPILSVVNYSLKSEMAHEPGLKDKITEILAGSLKSVSVGKFHTSTEEIDLKVKLDGQSNQGDSVITTQPQDVLNLPVVDRGARVPPTLFRDAVITSYINEPDFKNRFNGKSTVILSGKIKQGSTLSPVRVKTLINGFFNTFSIDYPDVTLAFDGETEPTVNRFNAFFVGLFVAFSLIYLILAKRFGDYIQPVIVFTTVALIVIGVVLGASVFRTTITTGSLMALLGVAIVTINNAMILIEFMNIRINEGKPMRQAVKEACRARIRPVLLSTIAIMLCLLPMALGIPFNSLEWAPMAATFIIGIGCSALLILFVLPVKYEVVAWVKSTVANDPM